MNKVNSTSRFFAFLIVVFLGFPVLVCSQPALIILKTSDSIQVNYINSYSIDRLITNERFIKYSEIRKIMFEHEQNKYIAPTYKTLFKQLKKQKIDFNFSEEIQTNHLQTPSLQVTLDNENKEVLDDEDKVIYEMYGDQIKKDLDLRSDLFVDKDEFETSSEYEERLLKAEEYKQSIIQFYKDKRAEEIKNQIRRDSIANARKIVLLKDKVKKSFTRVILEIDEIGKYDADNGTFPVKINGQHETLKIPRDEAITFKPNFKAAKIISDKQLTRDGNTEVIFNMFAIHPISSKRYPIGLHREPLYIENPSTFQDIEIDPGNIAGDVNNPGLSDLDAAFVKGLQDRKYYALIIANQDYLDENIRDLNFPISDAKELADVLIKKYNFSKENTSILENPGESQLISEFDKLANIVTDKDNLLVFYAGHGIWDEKLEQGYWLPKDARKDTKAEWISNSTVRDYIRGIDSKHTLLVADACFSGSIFHARDAFSFNLKASNELYKLKSRKAMTSGTMKTVPDKSVFMKYLIQRLIDNQEPIISSSELFASFRDAVINNSPVQQVPQFGEIREAGNEGGDFIFIIK